MKTVRFAVALQLFVVFASGALVGGLAYRLYSMRNAPTMAERMPPGRSGRGGGPSFRERYVQELRQRLKLRQDQIRELDGILETTGKKFFEAKKRSDAEIHSLQENQQAQIRAMLDPTQIVEFEKMLREREERMRRDREQGRRPRP